MGYGCRKKVLECWAPNDVIHSAPWLAVSASLLVGKDSMLAIRDSFNETLISVKRLRPNMAVFAGGDDWTSAEPR